MPSNEADAYVWPHSSGQHGRTAKFKSWLFGSDAKLNIKLNQFALEALTYLAKEAVAEVLVFFFLVLFLSVLSLWI